MAGVDSFATQHRMITEEEANQTLLDKQLARKTIKEDAALSKMDDSQKEASAYQVHNYLQ